MVASVEKAGTVDYYDTFQEALDSTPTSGKPEDCTFTLLKYIEIDDFLGINGKSFTYKVLNGAAINFTKSYHYVNIDNDTDGNPSNVIMDGDIYFGKIRLGGKSSLKTTEKTTIGWLFDTFRTYRPGQLCCCNQRQRTHRQLPRIIFW